MPNNFLTVKQVAERLHRSRYTIWRWIREGELPAFKVKDGYLIKESSLNKILIKHQN